MVVRPAEAVVVLAGQGVHAVLPGATLNVPGAQAVQHVGDPVALPPKPELHVQPVIEEVAAGEFEPVGQHTHWYLVVLLHPRNEYVPAPHELRVTVTEQFVMELAHLLTLVQVCAVEPCTYRRTSRILRLRWTSAAGTGNGMPCRSEPALLDIRRKLLLLIITTDGVFVEFVILGILSAGSVVGILYEKSFFREESPTRQVIIKSMTHTRSL